MIFTNKFSELHNSQADTLQLEEELQFSKFLMERLTDPVFWISSDARIIYVNQAACNFVGHSYEELLSMTIYDVILDFSLEVWPNCWKTIRQQGSLYFESIHQTQENQWLTVEITASYMEYESREYGCILIRYISKRKHVSFVLSKANQVLEYRVEKLLTETKYVNQQLSHERAEYKWLKAKLENSLSLLQATLESIDCGVIAIGCDGDIISSNRKFAQMWQVPDSIISSCNYQQYLTFYISQINNPEILCRNIQQLNSQKDFESYDILELKDGRFFERCSKPLQLSEEIIGIVWSFRDITERQQAELENRRLLEQEKQLAEGRAQFVSMVSHEFRSPLNVISYSTSLLKRHSHHWSDEKKLQYLQRLQTATEQISHLMDEVLLIGSAEAGKLQCEMKPLDLNLFCREIVAEINLQTNSLSAVNFVSKGDCKPVWADKKLLQPVLMNLLSNAIKYSPINTKVDLILSYQDEKVIFQVKDKGIGISLEDQQQLFKPFYRGGNVGDIPGNGLGLAIVKKLVDLHHSQIDVVSEVGKGTIFTVTLLLKQPL
ncbi:PAS domain S-box protein [Nostoc muscorum FACHB-395]|uniref:sensor histidine kinase n=1 Tax=Nostoc sp. C057 TaxID=2576903 RepID=UPI0015C2DFCF|nr:PAS domain-containing sensor histidine kinase [Nostoc sp. C057]MBD2511530.1 PAS domain S-box protein [Desmonostoc muscorum FACHB-395]QLE53222.1 PAS domain S-box protein [Nostoc sp. C057]